MKRTANERMRICRDADCPSCGWPETYVEGTWERGPERLGCRKCGRSARGARYHDHAPRPAADPGPWGAVAASQEGNT